jgi:hypothetical protein
MAKGKALEVNQLEMSDEPVTKTRSIEIKVPGVDSAHAVVEVVYDTTIKTYDLGELHQDLELKIPVEEDAGEFSVRVIDVATTEEGEKRTLIAKS